MAPTATRYEFQRPEVFVGAPLDHADAYDFQAITVAWRGGATWAIQLGPSSSPTRVWCEAEQAWEWEPSPSSREDDFIARTRYTLADALAIGSRLATQ